MAVSGPVGRGSRLCRSAGGGHEPLLLPLVEKEHLLQKACKAGVARQGKALGEFPV